MCPSFASATLFQPTVRTDDNTGNGNCTLREAIRAANTNSAVDSCPAGSGADRINLARGTYVLSVPGRGEDAAKRGDLDVAGDLTIMGDLGGSKVDARGTDRVFDVHSGQVGFDTLTISGGNAGSGEGDGILARGGASRVFRSTVANSAPGADGDGVKLTGGQIRVDTSTVHGTEEAIDAIGGSVQLTMATLGRLRVTGSTAVAKGTLFFSACNGTISSRGYNLFEFPGSGCALQDRQETDFWGGFANASFLGDFGGPTQTHAVGFDSTLPSDSIDTGPPASDPDCGGRTDQRGIPRPQDSHCDIGAYEQELLPSDCEVERSIITGTDSAETLIGTDEDDLFFALGGRDELSGLRGDDCMQGGKGKDRLNGGQGDDVILVNKGGKKGRGGPGEDLVIGSSRRDRLVGGSGADRILGFSGRDVIKGGSGPDRIDCGRGRDRVRGAQRKDKISKDCERVRYK